MNSSSFVYNGEMSEELEDYLRKITAAKVPSTPAKRKEDETSLKHVHRMNALNRHVNYLRAAYDKVDPSEVAVYMFELAEWVVKNEHMRRVVTEWRFWGDLYLHEVVVYESTTEDPLVCTLLPKVFALMYMFEGGTSCLLETTYLGEPGG